MKKLTVIRLLALTICCTLLLTGCAELDRLFGGMFDFSGEEIGAENSMVGDEYDEGVVNGEIIFGGEDGIVAIKPNTTDNSDTTPTTNNNSNNNSGTGTTQVGTANELARFRSMTSSQLENEYFLPALIIYGELDGLGGIDCDWNADSLQKNGLYYQKVRSSQPNLDASIDFSKYENFRNYVYTVFEKAVADNILSSQFFLNHNGNLYLSDMGRGSDIYYQGCSYGVTKVTDTAVTVTVYARYVKGEYQDVMFDDGFELTEDKIETEPFNFTLVKQNGNWVFKTFTLWF